MADVFVLIVYQTLLKPCTFPAGIRQTICFQLNPMNIYLNATKQHVRVNNIYSLY